MMEAQMLQPSETLEEGVRQHAAFLDGVKSEVAVLVSELTRTSRRNIARIESTCAKIDLMTRQYLVFLTGLNAIRVAAEDKADSQAAFLDIRRDWGALTSRTSLFRSELMRWHDVRGLVQAQVKPKRHKLYSPDDKLARTTLSQVLASDDVFSWLHALFSPYPQSAEAKEQGCFPDIGLSNSEFHAHMHAAYRLFLAMRASPPARFLDVGCGAGLKVYAAVRYFEEATGFDFDPAYVTAGERFLGLDPAANTSIFQQDALTFDGYGDFDVIYFYRPISDDRRLIDMERRIAEGARPGTILIAPYLGFADRFATYGCGRVAGAVYLTRTAQTRAEFWRRKAETIGPYIVKPDDSPLKSVWSPIFDASRANGYDLPSRYKKPTY